MKILINWRKSAKNLIRSKNIYPLLTRISTLRLDSKEGMFRSLWRKVMLDWMINKTRLRLLGLRINHWSTREINIGNRLINYFNSIRGSSIIWIRKLHLLLKDQQNDLSSLLKLTNWLTHNLYLFLKVINGFL